MTGVRKIPAKTAALIGELLDICAPLNLSSTFEFSVIAKALGEHGIEAKALEFTVAFDPENWQRPETVPGLQVGRVITNGRGDYGWDALIEIERKRQGITGDYTDRMSSYETSFDGLIGLPGQNAQVIASMTEALERARTVLAQRTLDHTTPTVSRPGRRAGL